MDQATLREILRVQFEDAGINPLPSYYEIGLNLFEMNQSVPTVDYILSLHMQTHGGMGPGMGPGMAQGGIRLGGSNPLRQLIGQMMGNGGNQLMGNRGNQSQLDNIIIHPPNIGNPMEVEVREEDEEERDGGDREEGDREEGDREEGDREDRNEDQNQDEEESSERNRDTDEEEERNVNEEENEENRDNNNSLRRNRPAHRHRHHAHVPPINSDQDFLRFLAGMIENSNPNMTQLTMNGGNGNVASFVFQPNMGQMIDVKSVLSKEEMNNLPLIYIDETNNKFDQQECINCYDPFVKSDLVRILPCGHKFHHVCIDNQLTKESHLCPLCKNPAGNYTHINM
jgi:hypothetical protein